MLQVEFSKTIQKIADQTGKEIGPKLIWETFEREYVERTSPIAFVGHTTMPESGRSGMRSIDATIAMDGAERTIEGHGNGPIAAYVDALTRNCGVTITVRDYHQLAQIGRASCRARVCQHG